LVALLVFGAKRLPEIGSSIGKSIREFKKSMSDVSDAVTSNPEDRLPTTRQLDTPSTPPAGGEPKRLSE
jgi:sec-independent protein translocase protein TatA